MTAEAYELLRKENSSSTCSYITIVPCKFLWLCTQAIDNLYFCVASTAGENKHSTIVFPARAAIFSSSTASYQEINELNYPEKTKILRNLDDTNLETWSRVSKSIKKLIKVNMKVVSWKIREFI